ncbi:MAG TPA: hypothetical protein DCZ40_10100 [Lachnospiraceae bacterium]|nr:hypothetical protein [Lachnospiraceae bacterium]
MKIHNETLNIVLNQMPLVPPEAGGIIGGKEGQIILWEYDAGYFAKGCSYCPNVNFLNEVIAAWLDKGYDFMGIVHVHFGGSKFLSDGDKKYIEKIMKAMPNSIGKLYFPIVVQPDKQIFSYVAYRSFGDEIVINADDVKVFF